MTKDTWHHMEEHWWTDQNVGVKKKAAKNIPLQSSMLVQADEIRLGLPAARTQNEQNTMITSFHLLSFTFTFCHNMMWGCNKIDVIQTIAIFHSILWLVGLNKFVWPPTHSIPEDGAMVRPLHTTVLAKHDQTPREWGEDWVFANIWLGYSTCVKNNTDSTPLLNN